MQKAPPTCSPTIRSWTGCARPASTLRAGPLQNTARRCGYRHRCSAGARNKRSPRRDAPIAALTGTAANPSVKAGPGERRQAMPFRVSGKNLDIGGALRERISARIVESLSKYFDGGYSGHVTVEKEGFGFRTECAIHLDSGITLHTEANAADAYASADQAALRIEKRLRRYKRRLKDHHQARANGVALDVPSYVIEAPAQGEDEEVTEFNPVIIAE